MKKKTLITMITLLFVFIFGICSSFAANNIGQEAVNGVRNVVGGAENVIEDAAGDITGGVRNGITGVTDKTQNVTEGAMTSDQSGNNGYNATRTTAREMTNGATNGFLGMSATTWTWIIIAIAAVVIIALIWYYARQKNENYHDSNS